MGRPEGGNDIMAKRKIVSNQSKKKSAGKKGIQGKAKPKEIMESIFNAITDGILVIDKDYKIALVNRALAHEYGFEQSEDTVGKKCYNVFRDRKKKCTDCVATKVFRTQKTLYLGDESYECYERIFFNQTKQTHRME